jgi:hypothetical protein
MTNNEALMTKEARNPNDESSASLNLRPSSIDHSFVIGASSFVIPFAVLLLSALFTGCVSRSKSQLRQYQAYMAGQHEAKATQQTPAVTFVGDVKNHSVTWAEDLTLAKGLLAAEYQALWDPHLILITRRGEIYKVNVKAFLGGGEDPPLEPGDVIEVRR